MSIINLHIVDILLINKRKIKAGEWTRGFPEDTKLYQVCSNEFNVMRGRKREQNPWPSISVGWGIVLYSKRLQVGFLIRAHT